MASLEGLLDLVLAITIAALMITTGLTSEPRAIVRCFRGRLLALSLRVVAANVLLIPLLVLVLLALTAFDRTFALLLLLLAIAPAAPLTPAMVILNRGDVNWALSLMLALTLISLFSIPGMVWLGRFVLAGGLQLRALSADQFVDGYVLPVFLPLGLAMLLKAYGERVAERIRSLCQRLVGVLSVLMLVLVVFLHRHDLGALSLWRSLSLMAFIIVFSAVGAVSVFPHGTRAEYTTAIITTGYRNFLIVMVLVNMLSPDRAALLQIIPVFLFTMAVFVCAGLWTSRRAPAAYRGKLAAEEAR